VSVVATIEARMTSSRLPGKVLMEAGGEPLLGILIRRLKAVAEIDAIVVATTVNATDDPIRQVALDYGASVFRGSEEDVLARVVGALKEAEAATAVEITADCPLLDPRLVSDMIQRYRLVKGRHRYVANTSGPVPGAPAGQDIQIFSAEVLYEAAAETTDPADREHVSRYLYHAENADRFRPLFVQQLPEKVARRVWATLDYQEDYRLIKAAHEAADDPIFDVHALIEFYDAHPELALPCLRVRGLDDWGAIV
jgi:spore coat polysaccharide biosynthesis protein SpsF